MSLRSHGLGGGLTIDEYIEVYCYPNTEKVGSQIPTNSIQVLGLKAILLTLSRIAGLASLHQASRPLIFYDWSTALLSNMKQQLSDYMMVRV